MQSTNASQSEHEVVDKEANALRIRFIERCFGSNGKPLASPGRMLLGEGVLNKVCRKDIRPRQFFLFNDALVYGTIVEDKKKYTKQTIIPTSDMYVISLRDTPEMANAWQITSPSRSVTIVAATAREKAAWVQHLARVTGRRTSHDTAERPIHHAPAWIPDKHASVCMCCHSTKFSSLARRHHCRKCGDVVCASCSKNRFLLQSQSAKPLRVCRVCYTKLQASGDRLALEPSSIPFSGNYENDSAGSGMSDSATSDHDHDQPGHGALSDSDSDDD